MRISIKLEGSKARELATTFVSSNKEIFLLEKEQKNIQAVRSLDWTAIIELISQVEPAVDVVEKGVSISYLIWKWLQEIKGENDVTIEKEEDGNLETKKLDSLTTKEEIEKFIK